MGRVDEKEREKQNRAKDKKKGTFCKKGKRDNDKGGRERKIDKQIRVKDKKKREKDKGL